MDSTMNDAPGCLETRPFLGAFSMGNYADVHPMPTVTVDATI